MKTAQDILNEKDRSIISVGPGVTVFEALKTMVEHKIGAMLVEQDGKIIGIFTERDLLNHSVEDGFDPKTALIKDYMVTKLCTVSYDEPTHKLPDLMLGKFCRHLLIMKENVHVGLLSAGDVMKAQMNEMSKELESVSWDYYENWCWKKKR